MRNFICGQKIAKIAHKNSDIFKVMAFFEFLLQCTCSEWLIIVWILSNRSQWINKWGKFLLISSNSIFCQDWHFLAIFDYFWDWKCYQMTKNIFQTFNFTENHKWKSNYWCIIHVTRFFASFLLAKTQKWHFLLRPWITFLVFNGFESGHA